MIYYIFSKSSQVLIVPLYHREDLDLEEEDMAEEEEDIIVIIPAVHINLDHMKMKQINGVKHMIIITIHITAKHHGRMMTKRRKRKRKRRRKRSRMKMVYMFIY